MSEATHADPSRLPRRLREPLLGALDADEQLVWVDRPAPWRAVLECSPFGLFGLLLISLPLGPLLESLSRGEPIPKEGLLATLAFMLAGLALLAIVPLAAWRARQAVYAITGRRAIIMRVGLRGRRAYYPPEGLSELTVWWHNIRFGSHLASEGFVSLRDVATPLRLLRELIAAWWRVRPDIGDEEILEYISRRSTAAGTGNFRSHKIVELRPGVLQLRGTLRSQLFFSAFAIVGSIALAAEMREALPALVEDSSHWGGVVFIAGLGGLFITIGVLGMTDWFGRRRVTFDTLQGRLWTGRRKFGPAARAEGLPLSAVLAVQVCGGATAGATELNVVLRTEPDQFPRRANLTSHSKQPALYADARRLAKLLGVPLLDHA